MHEDDAHAKAFLILLVAVSAAFLCIVFPMFGAVLWAVTFSILFDTLNRRLRRSAHLGPTTAALTTTALVLLLVILPTVILSGVIAQEGASLLQQLRSGEIDLSLYYRRMLGVLPDWLTRLLQSAGLDDLASVQERLRASAASGTQPIASRLWLISQGTLDLSVNFFVMLYLLFFLLRDGDRLLRRIERALPLAPAVRQRLFRNFATVVRSTVKGNVVVAVIQGALGAVALAVLGLPGAVLWGVVMAVLSLLPAVGAALVWGPIAVYLMAVGDVGKGLGLAAFGTLVIGLVDNVLRPVLVGKETRMPDYVVLISTIGGMSLFGVNGFVIGPVIAALFIAVWDIASQGSPAHPHDSMTP
ncbi:MAG: AI-2E family transporter [Rhizobacter sp.]|nr:AI-2E family transporter [Rhizobacter sp.]